MFLRNTSVKPIVPINHIILTELTDWLYIAFVTLRRRLVVLWRCVRCEQNQNLTDSKATRNGRTLFPTPGKVSKLNIAIYPNNVLYELFVYLIVALCALVTEVKVPHPLQQISMSEVGFWALLPMLGPWHYAVDVTITPIKSLQPH